MKLKKLLKGPNVNRVVKFFVAADLLLWAGVGIISPIFSIFIVEDIIGATLVTVGISSAMYWFARSLIQPPIAEYIDKRNGEKDDFYVLLFGLLITSLTAFLFALISTIPQLYILQLIHGIGLGAYSVAWSAIFSRHLDKNRVAFDWSIDRASLGVAIGITSVIGGALASTFGFDVTFVVFGTLALLSAVVVFFVPDLVFPPENKEEQSVHIGRRHINVTE